MRTAEELKKRLDDAYRAAGYSTDVRTYARNIAARIIDSFFEDFEEVEARRGDTAASLQASRRCDAGGGSFTALVRKLRPETLEVSRDTLAVLKEAGVELKRAHDSVSPELDGALAEADDLL